MWQGTNVALDQRLYLHLSYTNVFVKLVFTIQSSVDRRFMDYLQQMREQNDLRRK